MNKYIAGIIDELALCDLHRKRSKTSHFKTGLPKGISDFNHSSFYCCPHTPKVDIELSIQKDHYNIGTYSFESEIDNAPCNKLVSGAYYKSNISTRSEYTVIFVHGWRMDDFKKIENIYSNDFIKKGFDIYYFTLPYHLDRQPHHSLYNGELMMSSDIGRTLLSVKQAISDLQALIKWIKENGKSKIILIGVSLGGFITNLAATVIKEIDILISVFYANNVAYSIWDTISGKYIKKDFVENGYTYEELHNNWAVIDPSLFKPVIPKENILLFSGKYDKFVHIEDTDRLWVTWGKPERIVYPCGHAGIVLCRNRIAKDSIEFIEKVERSSR